MRLYGKKRAIELLDGYAPFLRVLADRYPLPEECIRAVVYKEMIELNVLDAAADAAPEVELPR